MPGQVAEEQGESLGSSQRPGAPFLGIITLGQGLACVGAASMGSGREPGMAAGPFHCSILLNEEAVLGDFLGWDLSSLPEALPPPDSAAL